MVRQFLSGKNLLINTGISESPHTRKSSLTNCDSQPNFKKGMIMTKSKEVTEIYDPIFRQTYYYFSCKTHKDYCKILKSDLNIIKEPKININGECSVYAFNGNEVCFIWVKTKRVSFIAHEVFHAVSYVLRHKGVPLSDNTDEVYAYLTEFLVREIIKKRS